MLYNEDIKEILY